MFNIDFTFLWTLVNLIVLFLFLRKFLFNRVNAFLEKRAQNISEEMERAEKEHASARALRGEYEERIKAAGAEGAAIVKQARDAAGTQAARIIENAREEAAQIVQTARRQMDAERQAACLTFKAQAAALTLAAAGRILRREITTDDNKRFAEAVLREAGADSFGL